MSERRFFGNIIGNTAIIEGGELLHLSGVLRLKQGDRIIVCPGDGYDYLCALTAVSKAAAEGEVLSCAFNPDSKIELTLFQAALKGEKLDLVTQKFTELGGHAIVPFFSKNTDVKPGSGRPERAARIAKEAAKQCGRSRITQVFPAITLKEIPQLLKDFDFIFFPYEREQSGFFSAALKNAAAVRAEREKAGKIFRAALIIGPEGGFTPEEAVLLAESGAALVSMGKKILRAETAAITAAAVIMQGLGCWDEGAGG